MKASVYGDLHNITNKAGTNELVLKFITQEVSDEAAGVIMGMRNKYINILLSTSEITQEDADEIEDEFNIVPLVEQKTPSQRLRNVLYVQWEGRYKTRYPKFDSFYEQRMEQIIEAEKDRI